MLRYRIGSSATYGFAVRNGRDLTDNVPEVMFSLVTNSAPSGGLSKRHAAGATPEDSLRAATPSLLDSGA